MEKDIKLRFHVFKIKNVATLILAEPKPKEYIWIYLCLDAPLRNGVISIELTKYVLYHLNGKHHIHWLANLKSFQILSKELSWHTKKKSDIFYGCKYSETTNLTTQPGLYPLFNSIVSYRLTTRKPTSLKYQSSREEKEILSRIKKHS